MLSADQVFDHHLSVFGEGNIDEILTNYTNDTIMIYGDKSWRGPARRTRVLSDVARRPHPGGQPFRGAYPRCRRRLFIYYLAGRICALSLRLRHQYVFNPKRQDHAPNCRHLSSSKILIGLIMKSRHLFFIGIALSLVAGRVSTTSRSDASVFE